MIKFHYGFFFFFMIIALCFSNIYVIFVVFNTKLTYDKTDKMVKLLQDRHTHTYLCSMSFFLLLLFCKCIQINKVYERKLDDFAVSVAYTDY